MKSPALLILLFVICLVGDLFSQSGRSDYEFSRADSVARLYPEHSLYNLKSLADKLTAPFANDTEKFRAIYMWVCLNTETDYDLYLKIKRKRLKWGDNPKALAAWDKKINPVVIQKLLTQNRTVCTGYAYLVRELALHAGLRCVIVDGYTRRVRLNAGGYTLPNHSWNAVQLNNTWHLCDATWSSGRIDGNTGKFVARYTDAYFLPDPKQFLRDHYPLDKQWILIEDHSTLQEFLK